MVHQVTIPLLCRCRDTLDQLRDTFLKTNRLYFMLVFPVLLGLAATAHPLVRAVYGEQWLAIVPYVRVLAGAAVFFSVWYSAGILQVPRGRMDVGFRWSLLQFPIKAGAVAVAAKFGLMPLVLTVLLVHFVFMLLSYACVIRPLVGSCLRGFYGDTVLVPLLYSLAMFGVVHLSGVHFPHAPPAVSLAGSVLLGIACYAACLAALERRLFAGLASSARALCMGRSRDVPPGA
jgi:O-antigen/teichoic acid export membrane protein